MLFLFLPVVVNGQYTKEFKRIFFDAEYLYQTGFYEEAFNRYKNLLTLDPGNSNILFHCGACCLNIPGRQEEAILYLKEAAGGVDLSYKERSHKEPGAPVLTYFYLGRAYHLDNQFDAAVRNYEKYLEAGTDEDPMQLEYAGLQIAACQRAREVVGSPPSFEFQNVLDRFNDELPSSNNPVISGDGNILIFLVDYPSDKKIVMSNRHDGVWSRPRVINSELGMVGETYPVCLSYDGKELYIVHQYYSHSDILVSRFEGGRWSEAEELNHHINGRTSETHASISRDGNTLYFTSDRRGGMGSYDIYLSRKDADGDWGPPTSLGPVVNTPYEEHTPFISANDSILFFSSQGHASIGGIDVFFSERTGGGTWSEPVNVGFPVNTTGEDVFFNPGWDEMDGYYAVRRRSDPTTNIINMVIELEPEEQVAAELAEEARSAARQDSGALTGEPVPPRQELPAGQEEQHPQEQQPQEQQPSSITQAIEPPVTDEIEEIMNWKPGEKAVPAPAESGMPYTFQTGVPFDYNDCSLNMAAMVEVEKILDLLEAHPGVHVVLTGHADAKGSPEYNMLLSLKRADRIAQYLIGKGIEEERISVQGRGEAAPLARNEYPDGTDAPLGRYLNRLVTVTLADLPPGETGLAELYVPKSLRPKSDEPNPDLTASCQLTIQVMADLRPVDMSHFQDLDTVKEFVCRDGYYRYTCGVFTGYREAKTRLDELHRSGYPDAFIKTLEWYEKASR